MNLHNNAWAYHGINDVPQMVAPSATLWFVDLVLTFKFMLAVRHSRRHLRELEPAQLLDIGIDDVTAQREANRSFWDIKGVSL